MQAAKYDPTLTTVSQNIIEKGTGDTKAPCPLIAVFLFPQRRLLPFLELRRAYIKVFPCD